MWPAPAAASVQDQKQRQATRANSTVCMIDHVCFPPMQMFTLLKTILEAGSLFGVRLALL